MNLEFKIGCIVAKHQHSFKTFTKVVLHVPVMELCMKILLVHVYVCVCMYVWGAFESVT